MNRLLLAACLLLFSTLLRAGACNEGCRVDQWCLGETEVVLPTGKRVDCLTETHAIEADWPHKWAEAIGQALHYGQQTGKTPGVLMIMPGDRPVIEGKNLAILIHTLESAGVRSTVWAWFLDGDKVFRVEVGL